MGSEVISADSAKFFHSFTFLLIFLCSCTPKHSYQVSKRNSYTELNGESWENLEKKITQLEIQNLALKFERRWLIARNKLVAAELELNLALSSKAKLQAEELKYINEIKGKNSSSNNDSSNNNDLFGGSQDFSDRRFTAEKSSTQGDDQEGEEQNTFYRTKIPWSINLRHSLTYSNAKKNRDISNNSLMVSGSFGLTPKWDVGVSTGYDFKNKGITYTNFRIERDLDSWVMNLAWTPFGNRQSWYFFIGVRSGFLSDLKYEKRREPDRKL